jgi:histidyl-tRNA synthetase
MAELGGQELSGIGFGLGVDRTLLACQAEGLSVGDQSRCDVYCVPMGETAKRTLVAATGGLRAHGVRVDIAYGGKGLKGAMKAADRSGARFALVLGERDLESGSAQLKELTTGEQRAVSLESLVDDVRAAVAESR